MRQPEDDPAELLATAAKKASEKIKVAKLISIEGILLQDLASKGFRCPVCHKKHIKVIYPCQLRRRKRTG